MNQLALHFAEMPPGKNTKVSVTAHAIACLAEGLPV